MPVQLDHIGGVVGDDIHEHLDAQGMGIVHQVLELLVGAQMRVDLLVIQDPVAVIAGRMSVEVGGVGLDGLILENRTDPDRRHAHIGQVIQLGAQPGQVAAVVVTAIAGQVAVGEHVGLGIVDRRRSAA